MSKTLLLADDDDDVREVVARWLTAKGYVVESVSSGASAVAALKARPFDLVITDIRMPNGDGLAVLDAARNAAPAVPVIAITGFADCEERTIRERGAVRIYYKPFRIETLLADIAELTGS